MMIDQDRLSDLKNLLADRLTAYELVELLNLSVWDILENEAFEEVLMETDWSEVLR